MTAGYIIPGCVIVVAHLGLITDSVTFENLPSEIAVNENTDWETDILAFRAMCYPMANVYNKSGGMIGTSHYTVECQHCEICSNSSTQLFFMSGKTIYKRACSNTSCGNSPSLKKCSSTYGCINAGESFDIEIECYTTSYDFNDNGTATLTVTVTPETPKLIINLPATVKASKTMNQNTSLFIVNETSGPSIVEITKVSSVADSYQLDTEDLFDMNPNTGVVYINKDPRQEFSYTYTMDMCIYSRRQQSCGNLTIIFDGCFQTPNCIDQTGKFSDQQEMGGTLFTMISDPPSVYFSSISKTWQNLRYVITIKTLDGVQINEMSGAITTTTNLTAWPEYPFASYTVVVSVSNPGYSCTYTSTCTVTFAVYFTNWPIQVKSLPAVSTIHEDHDKAEIVHSIITSDQNNPAQDNVTCALIANDDPTLIELYHNGGFNYNSYHIIKKDCGDPGCGYLRDNFLCPTGIGCMNLKMQSRYNVTVQCKDAYGASDTKDFVLVVKENSPPIWKNDPYLEVDTSEISPGDVLVKIGYSDAEGENLTFNVTNTPDLSEILIVYGNNSESAVKIVAGQCLRQVDNTSILVSWSAYDRRNLVNSSLLINLTNICYTPTEPDGGYYKLTSTCDVVMATLTCHTGYTMSGSKIQFCQNDGTWNGTYPSCVLCPETKNISSGSVQLTSDGATTQAAYTCAAGYSLKGAANLTCQGTGTWDKTPPMCECDLPSKPSNGTVSFSANKTEVLYSCDTGFNLLGPVTQTCQTDGSGWSDSSPTCSACSELISLSSGYYNLTSTGLVTMASFTCSVGYTMSGSRTRYCQPDGSWNGTDTSCGACCELPVPVGGDYNLTTSGTVTKATFVCNRDYKMFGSETRYCQTDGSWNGTHTTCRQTDIAGTLKTDSSINLLPAELAGIIIGSCLVTALVVVAGFKCRRNKDTLNQTYINPVDSTRTSDERVPNDNGQNQVPGNDNTLYSVEHSNNDLDQTREKYTYSSVYDGRVDSLDSSHYQAPNDNKRTQYSVERSHDNDLDQKTGKYTYSYESVGRVDHLDNSLYHDDNESTQYFVEGSRDNDLDQTTEKYTYSSVSIGRVDEKGNNHCQALDCNDNTQFSVEHPHGNSSNQTIETYAFSSVSDGTADNQNNADYEFPDNNDNEQYSVERSHDTGTHQTTAKYAYSPVSDGTVDNQDNDNDDEANEKPIPSKRPFIKINNLHQSDDSVCNEENSDMGKHLAHSGSIEIQLAVENVVNDGSSHMSVDSSTPNGNRYDQVKNDSLT